ncbi:MAG: double zinc ribbon domain-containing protein, partial [Bryobacteraceae bacterium]
MYQEKLYTGDVILSFWRWVFSSSLLLSTARWLKPSSGYPAVRKALCAPLEWIFPDDCRICGEPLRELSRIPVCNECLKSPAPLAAEYFCSTCGTPFLNRFPLDENGRCMLCRLGLAGFDRVYSFGSYESALRKLIHLYKYDGVRPLARPFGEMLARALPPEER